MRTRLIHPHWMRFRLGFGTIVCLLALSWSIGGLAQDLSAATKRLFDAVWVNDLAQVKASISAGADLTVINELGVRPVDMAVDKGHYEIAHFLLSVEKQRRDSATRAANPTPDERVADRAVEWMPVSTPSMAPTSASASALAPASSSSTSPASSEAALPSGSSWLTARPIDRPPARPIDRITDRSTMAPAGEAPQPAPVAAVMSAGLASATAPTMSTAAPSQEKLWSPGDSGEIEAAPALNILDVATPRPIAPTVSRADTEQASATASTTTSAPTSALATTPVIAAPPEKSWAVSGWFDRVKNIFSRAPSDVSPTGVSPTGPEFRAANAAPSAPSASDESTSKITNTSTSTEPVPATVKANDAPKVSEGKVSAPTEEPRPNIFARLANVFSGGQPDPAAAADPATSIQSNAEPQVVAAPKPVNVEPAASGTTVAPASAPVAAADAAPKQGIFSRLANLFGGAKETASPAALPKHTPLKPDSIRKVALPPKDPPFAPPTQANRQAKETGAHGAPAETDAKRPPPGSSSASSPANPSRKAERATSITPLTGVLLSLANGQGLEARVPAPDGARCIEKTRWNTVYCIEPLVWQPTLAEAFEVRSKFYRGSQSIVEYVAGNAVQIHALFQAVAWPRVSEYFTAQLGPPTETPKIWTALIGQPRRRNQTLRWHSADPKTGKMTVLEIREIDDLRWSSPPDMKHGVIRLLVAGRGSVFELLSPTDMLLVQLRKGR